MKDEIVLYQPNEQFQLEVQLKDETVWLTQDQMSQLFDRDRTVIGRHIRNIFSEGELDESLVCAKFALPKKYGRHGGHKSLRDSHNASKGKQPINTHKWSKASHDRWVIIDDTLYHCGHSVKDLGKKLSAIMKMDWNPEVVLKEVR